MDYQDALKNPQIYNIVKENLRNNIYTDDTLRLITIDEKHYLKRNNGNFLFDRNNKNNSKIIPFSVLQILETYIYAEEHNYDHFIFWTKPHLTPQLYFSIHFYNALCMKK